MAHYMQAKFNTTTANNILADLFTSIFSLPPAPPRWLHCQQNTDFDTAAEAVKAKFLFIRCRHQEQVASKCASE